MVLSTHNKILIKALRQKKDYRAMKQSAELTLYRAVKQSAELTLYRAVKQSAELTLYRAVKQSAELTLSRLSYHTQKIDRTQSQTDLVRCYQA